MIIIGLVVVFGGNQRAAYHETLQVVCAALCPYGSRC